MCLNKKLIVIEKDKKEPPRKTIFQSIEAKVQWTGGLWAKKTKLLSDVLIPGQEHVMQHPENGAYLTNFKILAGLVEGNWGGANCGDGDCYKWMEALAWSVSTINSKENAKKLSEWLDILKKAQDPDGYINTEVQLKKVRRWGLDTDPGAEMYNLGHLFTAGSTHFALTGKKDFLNIAVKAADCLYNRYKEADRLYPHSTCVIGLMNLYEAVNDAKCLELARVLFDRKGTTGGSDQWQDRVPLRDETTAAGHADSAAWEYIAGLLLFRETGDMELWKAVHRIWDIIVKRHVYIHGGIGSLHTGTNWRGDAVSEAFGAEYELPNVTAYCESCGNSYWATLNWMMFQQTGDAFCMDLVENVLFNSILAGISHNDSRYFYTNVLERFLDSKLLFNDTKERWSIFKWFCCPPQLARTISMTSAFAYSVTDRDIWINMYGSNRLETEMEDTGKILLVQESDYPWNGKIRIILENIQRSGCFKVMLRIPGWTDKGAGIRINRAQWDEEAKPGTYAVLERVWNEGDIIELELPMEAHLIEAHPSVEEDRNKAAIMRGPVLYCMETDDLPEGIALKEASIYPDTAFTAEYDPKVCGGVMMLNGKCVAGGKVMENYLPDYTGWENRLYRKIQYPEALESKRREFDIRLIPYFACANRKLPYFKVWLPLQK